MILKRSVALAVLCCASANVFGAAITNPSFEADTYTVWPGYTSGNGGTLTGWTASLNGDTAAGQATRRST